MDARSPQIVRAVQGRRPADRPRPVGRGLDRRAPRQQAAGAGRRPTSRQRPAVPDGARSRQRAARPPAPDAPRPARPGDGRRPRRPAVRAQRPPGPGARRGDAVRRRELERHRHRLDLRRPRHLQEVQGRVLDGRRRRRALDTRAFSPTSCGTAGGWPAGCEAARRRCGSRFPRWSPGRRRPRSASAARSSCGPRCRSATWCWTEPSLADQRSDVERMLAAMDDLELRVDLHAVAALGRPDPARRGLQGHRRRSSTTC